VKAGGRERRTARRGAGAIAWVVGVQAIVLLIAPSSLHARVALSADGFTSDHEAVVAASAADTYRALVNETGAWWNPRHTYSGDARNVSLNARPGGCLCETLPEGGGVEHLHVVHVVPGKLLRLTGGLGPLQASGVAGALTWTLSETDSATTVSLSYVVGGYMRGGFEPVAAAVDAVVGNQLERLKRYLETGTAEEADEP